MKVFEPFQLDAVSFCLWRGRERVRLSPKAFDILRYLVEHADRLVAHAELLEALWPETYINPEGIRKYIVEIRKALGDRLDTPLFIETFPKRGYQFVAKVRDQHVLPPSGPAATEEPGALQRVIPESTHRRIAREICKALGATTAHGSLIVILGDFNSGDASRLDRTPTFVQRQVLRIQTG